MLPLSSSCNWRASCGLDELVSHTHRALGLSFVYELTIIKPCLLHNPGDEPTP